MGQEQSAVAAEASPEQLSQELALKFANQCYTSLEVYCFKEVFRELADADSGVKHWREETLCRFLEIPDVLQSGPVLFQMASFLGSFPFWELSPCILTASNLLKVVTLLTGRYKKILKDNEQDRYQLFYASMAVVDRRASEVFRPEEFGLGVTDEEALEETLKGVSGFSIKSSVEERLPSVDGQGALAGSAFNLLNLLAPNFTALHNRPEVKLSIIPSDNLLQLVELILFAAPMEAQTDLAAYSAQFSEQHLSTLRAAANCILASFSIEQRHGITFPTFRNVVSTSLPHMFEGLGALFEHFLFDRGFNLSARKHSTSSDEDSTTSPTVPEVPKEKARRMEIKGVPFVSPISETGDILNLVVLTQISFFIHPSVMFHRLHHLFAGSKHGFSLGSFEKQVFTWKAPTILLVKGTLLPDNPENSRERSFADSLPPQRFSNSSAASPTGEFKNSGRTVVYGAYISQPWRHTHKSHFGDVNTKLFQLSPIHDVFNASSVSKEYVSYLTPSPQAPHAGVNLGSPLPSTAASKAKEHPALSSLNNLVILGPVSLYLDDSLEFGVFTHTASGGGSFHPSTSPARTQHSTYPQARPPTQGFETASPTSPTARRRSRGASFASPVSPASPPPSVHNRTTSTISRGNSTGDWQDRFEIEAVEVWGCGGDEEAEKQRRRIDGEEREARMRREGIIGRTGDIDADREILRMAGLIGMHREGGSV